MRLILAFREAGMRFNRDGCAFLSQAIAFNALFAIFPLFVLILTGASLVYPDANGKILAFIDEFAPALHETVANDLQTYVYSRGISSIIALLVVVWAGKNLFMGLAYALNRALAVPKSRPLLHDIVLSIIMLPAAGIVMIVAMGLPIVISLFVVYAKLPDPQNVSEVLAYSLSMLLIFIVVIVLYTFLPNRPVKVAVCGSRREFRRTDVAGRSIRVRVLYRARQFHACLRRSLRAARPVALVLSPRSHLSLRCRA